MDFRTLPVWCEWYPSCYIFVRLNHEQRFEGMKTKAVFACVYLRTTHVHLYRYLHPRARTEYRQTGCSAPA